MSQPDPVVPTGVPAPTHRSPERLDAKLAPLVLGMAQADQEAMAKLYDLTSGLVHGIALRMLENPEDAEEVVLDVYMKAWRNAATYSLDRGSVTAWLVMMTRTVSIDRIRTRHAQPRTFDLAEVDLPGTSQTPEDATAQGQWRSRIQTAIVELPREQREALLLAFFGGHSHAELAARLQVPLGTIKTRIRLGLRRLRISLGESAAHA